MQVVGIYFNMLNKKRDWMRPKPNKFLDKLSTVLHTATAGQYYTVILNLTMFWWIHKETFKFVILESADL